MTNCLVAKMCINLSEIHVSYSFSYMRIQSIEGGKKLESPFKTYMLIMLINDCIHACVMTSVVYSW